MEKLKKATQQKIPVTMRFNPATIRSVEKLTDLTGLTNKTQIVAQAIALYLEIEEATKKEKGALYIEYPNGIRERLLLIK